MFVQEDQEKSHHSDEDKLQALRNSENQSARYLHTQGGLPGGRVHMGMNEIKSRAMPLASLWPGGLPDSITPAWAPVMTLATHQKNLIPQSKVWE